MKNIYVLRRYVDETYDDPDEGQVNIGTYYTDLYLSEDVAKLEAIAANLNKGFGPMRGWTLERMNELRKLDPHYNSLPSDNTYYMVENVSELLQLPKE